MERDIGDIFDRWSIAKLKMERIGTEENKKEFVHFEAARQVLIEEHSDLCLEDWSKIIYDINDFIWQLEAGLKSGKEKLKNPHYVLDPDNTEALSKIGLTSMLIRNFNHLRVGYKNLLNKLTGEGFQDIKKDHLS